MGVLLPPAVNTPQEGRDQGKDPEHNEDGAEQGNQVVSFVVGLEDSYAFDGLDDGAVTVVLVYQVKYLNLNVFNRTPVRPGLFCGNADMNLVAG